MSESRAMSLKKPRCHLISTDGNIFSLMGAAGKALKEAGQRAQYVAMLSRIQAEARSYGQALNIIAEYVEVE